MLVRFGTLAPFRLARRHPAVSAHSARQEHRRPDHPGIAIWIVPAGFAVAFLLLLFLGQSADRNGAQRHPLRERLRSLPAVAHRPLGLRRRDGLAAAACRGCCPGRVPEMQGPVQPRAESLIFGRAAILRSLIVFNVLFAVQTVLDAAYLWGGVRAARRHELCRLCASRRLSADRHGAARRRFRAGRACGQATAPARSRR